MYTGSERAVPTEYFMAARCCAPRSAVLQDPGSGRVRRLRVCSADGRLRCLWVPCDTETRCKLVRDSQTAESRAALNLQGAPLAGCNSLICSMGIAPASTYSSRCAMAASGPWEGAGARQGVQVWRVENFRPVLQKDPKQLGKFFTGALDACVLAIAAVSCFPTKCSSPPRVAGDSYVVLHTVSSAAGSSTYNVHFWLGAKSTQVRNAERSKCKDRLHFPMFAPSRTHAAAGGLTPLGSQLCCRTRLALRRSWRQSSTTRWEGRQSSGGSCRAARARSSRTCALPSRLYSLLLHAALRHDADRRSEDDPRFMRA